MVELTSSDVTAMRLEKWRGLVKTGGFSFIAFGIVSIVSTVLGAFLRTTITVSQFSAYGISPAPTTVTFPIFSSNPLSNSTVDTGVRYIAGQAFWFQTQFLIIALGLGLLIPAVLALYAVVREVRRTPALVALALILAGIVVELSAIPSGFSTIYMTQQYVSAATDVQRTALVAAALSSQVTLNTGLILGNLLTSAAILLGGYVISKSKLGRATGYLGMFAGVVGIATTFLPYALSIIGDFLSIFGLIFVFAVGVQLTRLSR